MKTQAIKLPHQFPVGTKVRDTTNELERAKAECDKAWATSNRHLIERNQRIEQVRELLAACKKIIALVDNGNINVIHGDWNYSSVVAIDAMRAAITAAEKGAQP